MPKQYTGLGLNLLYPDTWTVNEEAIEGRPAVSLESPGGSFLSISSMPPDEDPEAMLDEAAEAMNSEYEDVESEPYTVEIAGQPYTGIVQRFYYLDFVVASKLLTIETEDHLYWCKYKAKIATWINSRWSSMRSSLRCYASSSLVCQQFLSGPLTEDCKTKD